MTFLIYWIVAMIGSVVINYVLMQFTDDDDN